MLTLVANRRRANRLCAAFLWSLLGAACRPAAPAAPPANETLVVGKSPPGPPLVVAETPAPHEENGRTARGDAPAIWLDSLTTPGTAHLPDGKVVIVTFWATWCAPCHQSFPKLEVLYERYRARGLEIVAVAVDDEKDGILDFAKAHGVHFPVAWDEGHALSGKYKLTNMPTTFVVDRKGNIAFTHLGYHAGEELQLEQELKDLL